MEKWFTRIRSAEIDIVKCWFKTGTRVLEIGGGNGYQASVMASLGCEVVSIDVPNRPALPKHYHPVQDYDGRNLPFPSASFDIVFSSNVLEHIGHLPSILTEIRRVLEPGGLAIHILPSSTWRFWTSLSHYVYLLKYLLGRQHSIPSVASPPSLTEKVNRHGLAYVIKRALVAGPHGEYSNALSELYYFSKGHWLGVFEANGFDVVKVTGNSLFYTGYGLFPTLSLHTRRKMARIIGSACNIFVMRVRPFPGESRA